MSGPTPPALEDARTEVLDDHVGLGDQLSENLGSLFTADVEGDGALVPRNDLPPEAVAVAVQTVRPSRITLRMLHLDHIRTHVAEKHCGDRCGVDGTDVEYSNTAQRAGAGCAVGSGGNLGHSGHVVSFARGSNRCDTV